MTRLCKTIVGSLAIGFVSCYSMIFAMKPSVVIQDHDDRKRSSTSSLQESFAKLVIREEKTSIPDPDLYAINFVCFGVLQFFMAHSNNEHVIRAIVRGIKNCPDRVIKLYFFCMDCKKNNLLNTNLVRGIEAFILNKLPGQDLRYLAFRLSCTGMPMFVVLDHHHDTDLDIYDDKFTDRLNSTLYTMNTCRTINDLSVFKPLSHESHDCYDYMQVVSSAKDLKSLINNYITLKYSSYPAAQRVIKRLRFHVLSFFVQAIKNQQVLYEIVKSIKFFPDTAIKLYFYCCEHVYLNPCDDQIILKIEGFLLAQINVHKKGFSLKNLTFLRNSNGLPEIEIRPYGACSSDMYEDEHIKASELPRGGCVIS